MLATFIAIVIVGCLVGLDEYKAIGKVLLGIVFILGIIVELF